MKTQMDFPNFFVAFRAHMEQSLDPAFQTAHNLLICDRLAALHAWFDSRVEAKVLGLIPIEGPNVHSHEHRIIFSVLHLDRTTLEDWWQYAQTLQDTLVHPDATHRFSLISLILVCNTADPAALRRLRWLSSEKNYRKPQYGWSSVRLAIVCAQTGKISTNRAGSPLRTLLHPVLLSM